MFKKFLLSVLFAVTVVNASAQYLTDGIGADPVKGNSTVVKYMIKAGANLTTVSSSIDGMDFSMAPGFQVGAAVNLRWGYRSEFSRPGTGIIGFQPELLFSNQSVSLSDGEKLTMNRLALPLMLRLYPVSSVYMEVGPEVSYLFSTTPDFVTVGSKIYGVGECSGLATDVALGAGWESKFGLAVGIRYGLGVTSMAKNLPWKTHNVSMTIGWMF